MILSFHPNIVAHENILCAGRLWPDAFDWRREPYEFESERLAIDLLAGGTWLRETAEGRADLAEAQSQWDRDISEFRETRAPFLLY